MIEIQVSGLVKSFEVGKNVLDGLTFQIDQGERVGLLGRNGAGKTTLFKILTGELGDLTEQAHYNMGALASMLGIDFVVAIGEKAAKIADGTAQSGGEVLHFATKEEAIGTLRQQMEPGTAMLVKASHAMHFGVLVEELQKAYD